MTKAIANLSYQLAQLCSDVESSTAGQNGAHRRAIANARAAMKKVEEESNVESGTYLRLSEA